MTNRKAGKNLIVINCFCGCSLSAKNKQQAIFWLDEHLDEFHPQVEHLTEIIPSE